MNDKKKSELATVPVDDDQMTFTDRGVRLDSPMAAVNFAKWCYESGYLPDHIKNAKQAFAILCRGAELGLPPFAAWRFVYMTKAGKLALETEGALAVCQASAVFEDYTERIEGEGNDMVAVAAAKRKGREVVVKEFSFARALKAGLLKPGRTRDGRTYDTVWQQYIEDMLLARARGRALRNAFPDVLGGIPVRGEAEDIARHEKERETPAAPTEPSPQTLPPQADGLLAGLLGETPPQQEEINARARGRALGEPVDAEFVPAQKEMLEEPPEPEGMGIPAPDAPASWECSGYVLHQQGEEPPPSSR